MDEAEFDNLVHAWLDGASDEALEHRIMHAVRQDARRGERLMHLMQVHAALGALPHDADRFAEQVATRLAWSGHAASFARTTRLELERRLRDRRRRVAWMSVGAMAAMLVFAAILVSIQQRPRPHAQGPAAPHVPESVVTPPDGSSEPREQASPGIVEAPPQAREASGLPGPVPPAPQAVDPPSHPPVARGASPPASSSDAAADAATPKSPAQDATRPAIARVVSAHAAVRLHRSGRGMALADHAALRDGDILVAPSSVGSLETAAVIAWSDGSRVRLFSDGSVKLQSDQHGPHLTLRSGRLACEVRRQPAGQTFRVSSRDANYTVLGTRFDIAQDARSERLEVYEGAVRVEPAVSATQPVVVRAGFGIQVSRTSNLSRIRAIEPRQWVFQHGHLPHPGYQGKDATLVLKGRAFESLDLEDEEIEIDAKTGSADQVQMTMGLLWWDLSTIPRDLQVVDATVELHVVNRSKAREQAKAIWLYACRDHWPKADRRTLDRAIALGEKSLLMGAITDAVHKGALRVTLMPEARTVIQQWIADPKRNHGIFMASDSTDGLDFCSNEHGVVHQRPKLILRLLPKIHRP